MTDTPDLFEKFGGTRRMAQLIDRPPSTVQSWKTAGRVPAAEQPRLIEIASQHGIAVTAEDVVWPLGRAKGRAELEGTS